MAVTDYGVMGELHDLFMTPAWDRLGPALVEVFSGLGTHDVVVDLGAGTGLGTISLVHHTRAEIWALEPERVMRAVLLHRVVADRDSVGRVSVVAGRVPGDLSALPTTVSGVVLTHALGHLDAEEREGLWSWVAHVLTPHGAVLLTCQEPADQGLGADQDADDVEAVVEEVAIGHHRYRATHTGTGTRFRTGYQVLDAHGTVLREHHVAGDWRPVSSRQVATEVAGHGLVSTSGPVAGVVVVRRDGTARG